MIQIAGPVVIAGSNCDPVRVQLVGCPARCPLQQEVSRPVAGLNEDLIRSFVVPNGRRLVVQTVSGIASNYNSYSSAAAAIEIRTVVDGHAGEYFVPMTQGQGFIPNMTQPSIWYVFGAQVAPFTADPGSTVAVRPAGDTTAEVR